MDQVEKLRLWGAAHGAARDAERQAAREGGQAGQELLLKSRALRERADRLHWEVYAELGRRSEGTGQPRM
jgi:hypothetical protein